MKLYNNDYLKVLSEITDGSVDLILTDIPYNISRDSGLAGYDEKNKRNRIGLDFGEWDHNFDESEMVNLTRVLKNGGSLVTFCAFEQIGILIETFKELKLKDKLIWKKTNPFIKNKERRYISNIEVCLWFVKGNGKWTFNRQNSNYESCVLSYPSESGGGFKRYHPTQKNLKLVTYLMDIHSNKNDVVLDPFMGGGTTGVACASSGRKFIGIELDKEYFETAKNRIEDVIGIYKFK